MITWRGPGLTAWLRSPPSLPSQLSRLSPFEAWADQLPICVQRDRHLGLHPEWVCQAPALYLPSASAVLIVLLSLTKSCDIDSPACTFAAKSVTNLVVKRRDRLSCELAKTRQEHLAARAADQQAADKACKENQVQSRHAALSLNQLLSANTKARRLDAAGAGRQLSHSWHSVALAYQLGCVMLQSCAASTDCSQCNVRIGGADTVEDQFGRDAALLTAGVQHIRYQTKLSGLNHDPPPSVYQL
jgi:hypothetical protein